MGSGFCDGDHFMVVTPIRFRARSSSKTPNQRAVVSLLRELPMSDRPGRPAGIQVKANEGNREL